MLTLFASPFLPFFAGLIWATRAYFQQASQPTNEAQHTRPMRQLDLIAPKAQWLQTSTAMLPNQSQPQACSLPCTKPRHAWPCLPYPCTARPAVPPCTSSWFLASLSTAHLQHCSPLLQLQLTATSSYPSRLNQPRMLMPNGFRLAPTNRSQTPPTPHLHDMTSTPTSALMITSHAIFFLPSRLQFVAVHSFPMFAAAPRLSSLRTTSHEQLQPTHVRRSSPSYCPSDDSSTYANSGPCCHASPSHARGSIVWL